MIEKFKYHRLKEINQVRIFIEENGKKVILSDTWVIDKDKNIADGVVSGWSYPKDFKNSEIHVEVSILCGLWIRLW